MKTASQIIQAMGQEDIAAIEKNNAYTLEIEGTAFELTLEDFEIVSKDIPGWQVASDRGLTVALDTTLTDALIQEGLAREIVNRVQNIRKNSDYQVTDRITITISDEEQLVPVIEHFGTYIKTETLADSITLSSTVKGEQFDINEHLSIHIEVSKV